jgi:hypothetical protein
MQTNTAMPTFPTQLHFIVIHVFSGLNYCRCLLTGKTQMIVAYRSASKQDGGTAHQIVLIVLVWYLWVQQISADTVTYSAHSCPSTSHIKPCNLHPKDVTWCDLFLDLARTTRGTPHAPLTKRLWSNSPGATWKTFVTSCDLDLLWCHVVLIPP